MENKDKVDNVISISIHKKLNSNYELYIALANETCSMKLPDIKRSDVVDAVSDLINGNYNTPTERSLRDT